MVGVPPLGYCWILRVPYSVFSPNPDCWCCCRFTSAALLRATCSYEGGGASSAMSLSPSVTPGASWGILGKLWLLSLVLRGGDCREADDTEGLRRRLVEPEAVEWEYRCAGTESRVVVLATLVEEDRAFGCR